MITTIKLGAISALLAAVCFGQPVAKKGQIAFVDSTRFTDRSSGIRPLVEAESVLGSVDTPCTFSCSTVEEQIAQKEKEIANKQAETKPFKREAEQLINLKNELNRLRTEHQAAYRQVERLVWKPVMEKIWTKMDEFAKQKNFAALVDKNHESILVMSGDALDVTIEFINYCNESFETNRDK